MLNLGNTLKEVRKSLAAAPLLDADQRANAWRYMLLNADILKDPTDDATADPDHLEMLDEDLLGMIGGYYHLVQGTDEDFAVMAEDGCPDFRLPRTLPKAEMDKMYASTRGLPDPIKPNAGLDRADFLDPRGTLAAVGVATNNGGGNIYLIPSSAFGKLPSFYDHVVHGLDWAGTDTAFQTRQAELQKQMATVEVSRPIA